MRGGGDGAEAREWEAEAALGGDEQPTACDTVLRGRRDCLPKVVGVRGGGGDETSGFAGGVGGVVRIGGVPVVWAVEQVRVQSVPRSGIGDGGEPRLGTFGVTKEGGEGWQSGGKGRVVAVELTLVGVGEVYCGVPFRVKGAEAAVFTVEGDEAGGNGVECVAESGELSEVGVVLIEEGGIGREIGAVGSEEGDEVRPD